MRRDLGKRSFVHAASMARLAALAASLLAVGCGASQRGRDGSDPRVAEGERLYGIYCSLCHGDEGEGYAADDANALMNQDFLVTATDTFLDTAIREGRPGTAMAAYGRRRGGPLLEEEIEALVRYIRSFQEEPSVDVHDWTVRGDPERARPIWSERCAGCHGERGEGDTALSLDNPVFHESASDGFIRYAIVHGRRDTPMPAFGEELSAEAIDDLVALIRSFERESAPRAADVVPDPRSMELVQNPEGPAPSFELREGRFVPAEQVAMALEEGARMVILDARAPSDWLAFHIPGAVPSPYYEVGAIADRLPRDGTFIVAYCGCPHAASGQVVDALRERGFENTAVLDEGIFYWRDHGYPVVSGDEP